MSETTHGNNADPGHSDAPERHGLAASLRKTIATGTERAPAPATVTPRSPSPSRDRTERGVAASVLAGGVAYRLFLWLLPFGLIVGGRSASNAASLQDAVASGGLPQAVVNAIGDIARAADSNSWWLLAHRRAAPALGGIHRSAAPCS